MQKNRPWIVVAVIALILIMAGEMAHAVWGESLTWDEGDHIFAGYESWKTHDYGLNPEHPPMVKMVAVLPLLPLALRVPPLQGRFFKTESYLDGRELLFRNGPANGGRYPARTLIFRVRMAAMIFTLIAALLVFAAGSEMFGLTAGLCSLLLFVFEPNLLAHGAYVTTDMGASCTIFATVYAFWRWSQRPTLLRILVTGVAAGLALAAKHSTVLLLPMLVLLSLGLLADFWFNRRETVRTTPAIGPLKLAGALVAIILVGVAVLWAFYGFRYAARPSPLALSPSLVDYVGPLAGAEAHGILFAGRHHLLPESWLYGLADVRAMANGMPSYFFGRVYAHGVWFYFPILFLIKTTLGMLGLLLLTVFAVAKGWLRNPRALWFLIAPPALYLLVAMDSHLNIGARHILPLWIFCCVLAGGGAAALLHWSRAWTWAVAVLLFLHVASSVADSPDYISYANEAWGGPSHTYRYLTDSNTDWGQQLVATSDYLRKNNIHDCWIAYFVAPFVLPADYGIPCKRLPTFDSFYNDEIVPVPPVISGTVLMSAGDLNGFEFGASALNPYESFRAVKPTAYIQNGMFVYTGTFAVPLASALGHVELSAAALKANDRATAIAEAREAVRLAPGELEPQFQLARALDAAGDKSGANTALDAAGPKIQSMEPDVRAVWQEKLNTLRASL